MNNVVILSREHAEICETGLYSINPTEISFPVADKIRSQLNSNSIQEAWEVLNSKIANKAKITTDGQTIVINSVARDMVLVENLLHFLKTIGIEIQ